MKKLFLLCFLIPVLSFGQAALLPDTLQQYADANGVPLANGFVCTTITGTSTPLATYPTAADANAMTNPNAVPVVLDSAGRGRIWTGAGTYRIAVYATTALGVSGTCNGVNVGPLIKTVDGVGSGAAGGSFTQHGVLFADTTSSFTNDGAFLYNSALQSLSIQHTVNNGSFILLFENTSSISGDGNGVEILAGNTSSDFVFNVAGSMGGASFMLIKGDGSTSFSGPVTITTPLAAASGGTGTAGPFVNTELVVGCPAGGGIVKLCSTSAPGGGSLTWGLSNGVLSVGNDGTLPPLAVVSTGSIGSNFGVSVLAGSNSSDYSLKIVNASSLGNMFVFWGDGGLALNNLTDKGVGTINATAYYSGNTAGVSATATVRNSAGSGTCTITFTTGLVTATTC